MGIFHWTIPDFGDDIIVNYIPYEGYEELAKINSLPDGYQFNEQNFYIKTIICNRAIRDILVEFCFIGVVYYRMSDKSSFINLLIENTIERPISYCRRPELYRMADKIFIMFIPTFDSYNDNRDEVLTKLFNHTFIIEENFSSITSRFLKYFKIIKNNNFTMLLSFPNYIFDDCKRNQAEIMQHANCVLRNVYKILKISTTEDQKKIICLNIFYDWDKDDLFMDTPILMHHYLLLDKIYSIILKNVSENVKTKNIRDQIQSNLKKRKQKKQIKVIYERMSKNIIVTKKKESIYNGFENKYFEIIESFDELIDLFGLNMSVNKQPSLSSNHKPDLIMYTIDDILISDQHCFILNDT